MAKTGGTRLKVIVWQVLGYGFLVLGVLGMFLPILQGFLFLAIGLIILARHAPWAAAAPRTTLRERRSRRAP